MMTMGRHWAAVSTRDAGVKPEVDAEIVARLSALPEDRVLDYFWLMSRNGVEPLPLLVQLGAVTITRPLSWSPAAIRAQHEAGTNGPRVAKRQCFACCIARVRLYYHHVVEVYHGGSNTARNRVPLCFECHQYLHPWLKEPPLMPRRDFEPVSAIAERAVDALEQDIMRGETRS